MVNEIFKKKSFLLLFDFDVHPSHAIKQQKDIFAGDKIINRQNSMLQFIFDWFLILIKSPLTR